MQVILLDKVVNLGQLGEVVRVKDGYGRNFLIPQGMARRATQKAIAEFEARRAELERLAAEKLSTAKALCAKLDGLLVEIRQKAGVDGRLFGSVTNADIADALKVKGLEVLKAQVRMPNGPIKAIGEVQLEVAPHTDAVANITVRVIGETV
ncbi:MAG: hypothetical protein RLZZ133_772 [Pseudomonadota bacterium]|jgi:large subunit ribosomal protein L9